MFTQSSFAGSLEGSQHRLPLELLEVYLQSKKHEVTLAMNLANEGL